MISILYTSTAVQPFRESDIPGLLESARETNLRLDVTGLLLFRGQQFMQVLEGEDDRVTALYADIAADPRHREVRMLVRTPIITRQFADWSMAFRSVSDESLREVPGYNAFLEPSLGAEKTWEDPTRAQWLLDWFRLRMV